MKTELEDQLKQLQTAGKQIAVTHEVPKTKEWLIEELKKSGMPIVPFSELSELEGRSDIGAIVLCFSSLRSPEALAQLSEVESFSRRLKIPFVVNSTSGINPQTVVKNIMRGENKESFLPREVVTGLDTERISEAIAQGLFELTHELDGASAYRRFAVQNL